MDVCAELMDIRTQQSVFPADGEKLFDSGHLGVRVRNLVGRRFAHQRIADSRESIRKRCLFFEALGPTRMNRVFSPIRIEIRGIRVQSSPPSHFLEGQLAETRFFVEARIDSRESAH